MKVEQAILLAQTIAAIQRSGRPMPTAFGFALAVNAEKLKIVCAPYEAARQELIKQYGAKDDAGELIVADGNISIADMPAFTAAMLELSSADTSVELDRLKLDKLPAEMEPAWVSGLMPIIDP